MRTRLHLEFPANREINRENRKNGPWATTRASLHAASMGVFIDIPYENQQGIISAEQGNHNLITGILDAQLMSALGVQSV
jgi:hypothetical protein